MTDASIVSGTLLAQVFIVAIMAVGVFLVAHERDENRLLSFLVILLALATLLPLIFTRGFSSTWAVLLGVGADVGLSRSTSMLVVFLVDIFTVTTLVWLTGGSRESPFQALYFLLPVLAIFLRESLSHLVLYLLIVVLLYSVLMFEVREKYRSTETLMVPIAYWFVSISCFIVATYIGYITRPHSMPQ